MKTPIVILITLLFASCGSPKSGGTQDSASVAKEIYTCPMHPSVMSDRPGACPVCGMALVKRTAQADATPSERASLGQLSLSSTQRVVANVATVPAQARSISRTISLVGVVDVAEPLQATVSARFRGRIERLSAGTTGERVERGQPLFELYSPDLVAAEQEFLLALSGRTGDDGQRASLLTGIRSRLRLNYGMTEEQITTIERTRTVATTVTFYSPIQGTIVAKSIREGDYVDEGSVLYRLADLSRVWINLDVYEYDLRFIRTGQTVVIRTEAYPGEEFSGRVTFIDPVMDPESRTTRVRTEFGNQHGRLKPNMYVTASLEFTADAPVTVPREAILETGKRTVVWVETAPNTFEPRDVHIGLRGDRFVEITAGLERSAVVASTGGFLLDSESQLRSDVSASGTPATSATDQPASSSGPHVIDIRVKGEYAPDVITVKKGRPLILRFYRDETSRCTEVVKFDELGISRKLPAFTTTEVQFTPQREGTIHFSCGMDMVHGRLVVE